MHQCELKVKPQHYQWPTTRALPGTTEVSQQSVMIMMIIQSEMATLRDKLETIFQSKTICFDIIYIYVCVLNIVYDEHHRLDCWVQDKTEAPMIYSYLFMVSNKLTYSIDQYIDCKIIQC